MAIYADNVAAMTNRIYALSQSAAGAAPHGEAYAVLTQLHFEASQIAQSIEHFRQRVHQVNGYAQSFPLVEVRPVYHTGAP
jgi:hypothetical protein